MITHTHGEVRPFGTLRCRIHFQLMWRKIIEIDQDFQKLLQRFHGIYFAAAVKGLMSECNDVCDLCRPKAFCVKFWRTCCFY